MANAIVYMGYKAVYMGYKAVYMGYKAVCHEEAIRFHLAADSRTRRAGGAAVLL